MPLPQQIAIPLRHIKRRVLLELNRPTNFGKTDLVHIISKRLRFRNYLEVCTSLSGNKYAEIHRARFRTARRLMYNCPETFDDGLPIDYRIVGFDIADAVNKLKDDADKIDICLVDGWHTYDCASRDLSCAYELLADGGALVVHDCLPPNEVIASPTWVPGHDWCGVSYRSYVDFVLSRSDLDYCTVDIDYGCGIIFKNRSITITDDALLSPEPKLVTDWFAVHSDDQIAFRFFMQNNRQLLRLIPAKAFVRGLDRSLIKPL